MVKTISAIEQYTEFIKGHFEAKKKKIDKEHIEKIYTWSRGQTYAIQLTCNYLFAQYNTVKAEDVESIFNNILTQYQAVYTILPKLLTLNQWNVIKAIAKEEPLYNPLSRDFIEKYQLGATSTVSSAIKALHKLEMVIVDEEAYLVHDVILARWMSRL